MAGSAPLGNKDLGALVHQKAFVSLDAGIKAGGQGVAVRLDVLGLELDGIDEKEHNGLGVCLARQQMHDAPAAKKT